MEDYVQTSYQGTVPSWYDEYREDIKTVIIEDGVTSIGDMTFSGYHSDLTNITIPNSVTRIGSFAFYMCSNLTNISIPSGVTSIEDYAFSGTGLTNVIIPDSVTRLGAAVFSGCSNLTSATIPVGITSIEGSMFSQCDSLANVTIPSSVTAIDYSAFLGCERLSDVYYGGTKTQWSAITIYSGNETLTSATIHFSAQDESVHIPKFSNDEYIYDSEDLASSMTLPTQFLDSVTDSRTAIKAMNELISIMTSDQKISPVGIDLATLYAEAASAKVASMMINGPAVTINASTVRGLAESASQAKQGVESALISGGINTVRTLPDTITLVTSSTDISVQIDPDILTTEVDKVRVETPGYALTFKLSDLAPDLTQALTFRAKSTVAGSTAPSGAVASFSGNANYQTITRSILANAAVPAVEIDMPGGKTSNSITVSLPSSSGNTTYQAVVSANGQATASKYNPATTTMDGKINTSGTYTVKTNEKDFTDIANKSAEMQKAIRYLASKGIISGTTATTFSPDGSINRAEIATLLVKALGKLDSTATASFSDVTKGNWFYTAAASSQRHKLINGYEDNTFRGTTNISKVQIVAVSSRVLKAEMGYKEPASPATYLSRYSDGVADWAQPEVSLATRENLVIYRTDGTFSGDRSMTRGDAAIIIYRLFQRIW